MADAAQGRGRSQVVTMAGSDRALLCRVRSHLCAIPLENVGETMRPLPTEALAGAPPFVLGLAIIRGEPVPVVDMGRLISAEDARPNRFVTVNIGQRRAALAVDGVLGVRTIDQESVHRMPPLLREAGREAIDAIGTLDAELLLVLRSTRLVPDEVFETLERTRSIS